MIGCTNGVRLRRPERGHLMAGVSLPIVIWKKNAHIFNLNSIETQQKIQLFALDIGFAVITLITSL